MREFVLLSCVIWACVPLAGGSVVFDVEEENQSGGPTDTVRPEILLPAPGVWTHLGREADRRSLALASDPGPAWLGDVAWVADTDALGRELEFVGPGGVVVDKRRVYASAGIEGAFHAVAVDRETGDVDWTTPLPPPAYNSWATPAIDLKNATVLYAAFDALIALDVETGAQVWSAPAQSLLVNASPVVTTDLGPADRAFITNFGVLTPPGRLICVNVDPYDAALNPYQPGDVVWSAALSQPTSGATPTYSSGVVYVATAGVLQSTAGAIQAFDATSTGTPSALWTISAPGPVKQGFFGGVTVSEGFVFGATYEFYGDQLSSLLVKINAQTGQLVWSAPCNRTSSIPIPVGGGRIAVSTGLFPEGEDDFGSRPSVQLFKDHGSFGELLWDSAVDTWDDANENGELDPGEYLAIGGWSHQPVHRRATGEHLLYVGTISKNDPQSPTFQAYDEMRLVDLDVLPGAPGFVIDAATGYGSTPAIVSNALFSVGPEGLTRAGFVGSAAPAAGTPDGSSPESKLEALRRRYLGDAAGWEGE